MAMVITTGVFSTWKSYPALGDLAVWAGLLGCFPEVISSKSKELIRTECRSAAPSLHLDGLSIHFSTVADATFTVAAHWNWERQLLLRRNDGPRAQL